MARFATPQKTWQVIVLVLAVAATVVVRMNRGTPTAPNANPRGPESSHSTAHTDPSGSVPPDSGKWEHLEGWTLVEDRSNDGESFLLQRGGLTVLFRLYFADCPEKYRNERNADRVADQARYFGGISDDATVATGEEARDFTLALLRKSTLTVDTRWENVYEPGRRYAFVTAGGKDLTELLVSRGLARIHTKGAAHPGGPSERDEQSRLHQMEREAKAARRGAWGRK